MILYIIIIIITIIINCIDNFRDETNMKIIQL